MKQKGFGIIALIVLIAVIVALLNVYAYYNPSFSLSKYSVFNYFASQRDARRIKDLKTIESAILNFYQDKNKMPGSTCGRISGVVHPDFVGDITPYIPNKGDVPFDPTAGNSSRDYFYYRYDDSHYLLMAVMELPSDSNGGLNGISDFSFSKCADWPGDNIYNYKLTNIEF